MRKFCYVATVPQAINVFLSDVIQSVAQHNSVTVITNCGGNNFSSKFSRFIPLNIVRKPALFNDLITLFELIKIFRQEKFDVIHSITPKAGLLSMLAACITRCPVRVHTFTGQVWLNTYGPKRWFLKFLDKILVLSSTHILVDSASQRDFLVAQGILKINQSTVISKGSICGVDTNVFKFDSESRHRIRLNLNVSESSIIILFMARLTEQKGVLELAEAFNTIAAINQDVFLYIIGPEEGVSFEQVIQICKPFESRVLRLEYTTDPASYLSASDILCLPSHMEGFGQVLVNASACCLPVVASRIYGITDAVEDNVTGLLFPVGDIKALIHSIMLLIENEALRKSMGEAGRVRVIKYFDKDFITAEIITLYNKLIDKSLIKK